MLLVVESSGAGTGRHVMDLAEGLLSRDCEVHLIYSPRRMDKLFADRLGRLSAMKSVPLPMRRSIHPGDFGMVRAVRRYLREFGPFDVRHRVPAAQELLAREKVSRFQRRHGLLND